MVVVVISGDLKTPARGSFPAKLPLIKQKLNKMPLSMVCQCN